MSFLSDWWEAFVISGYYEMGDPLALTKWGTPWPRAKSRGTGRGEASPVRNALK
jgi:hypothetical protein